MTYMQRNKQKDSEFSLIQKNLYIIAFILSSQKIMANRYLRSSSFYLGLLINMKMKGKSFQIFICRELY